VCVDDVLLPRFECDLPLVLPARPVLGEEARPVFAESGDHDAPLALYAAHAVVGVHGSHGCSASVNEPRPCVGTGNAERVDALLEGVDTAIPEIEPEKVGVRLLV
jgi:hypothetical protein